MNSNILLTGRPGVGKTTIVRRLLALVEPIAGGFLTEEIRQAGRRLGFRVRDVHGGAGAVFAHLDRKGAPRVGKYGVDVDTFRRIGVRAIREALSRAGLVVVDEIGKMELLCEAFEAAVAEAMDADQPVVATIPAYRHAFLDSLRQRSDVTLIEVTASSRDGLPAQLAELLIGPCGKARPPRQ